MNERSVLQMVQKCIPKMRLSRQKTLAACTSGCLRNPRGRLTELARGMGGQVQLRDRLKRISRFLGNDGVKIEKVGGSLLRWLVGRQGRLMPIVILMDWTKEHGQNVLLMSVKWGERSIPFYWLSVRDGEFEGVQTGIEVQALRKLRQWLPGERVIVLADRGFSKKELYNELKKLKMDYVIRVPGHTYMIHKEYKGKLNKVQLHEGKVRDFSRAKLGKNSQMPMRMVLKKIKVEGKWQQWSLATSLQEERKEVIINHYRRRMGIEATFKDLKTTLGWRFQKRLWKSDRLDRFLLILVMAMVCTLVIAERKGVDRIKRFVSLYKAWRGTKVVSFVQLGLWLIQRTGAQFSMIHPRKALFYGW